ncbi:hypothetical protein N7450_001647 [Penicillium hetheringtonii]|uniref:DUF676 domain-containing protein n=1 Tax=Penicillium hetheringtonii TaxID=911720 RepID=A0AAD6E5V5_9EURO|nr:hypothetical protein N7450_001647 [Penicillium hetheringtonii]
MLLVHQVGSVRVGEIARYTLTYTPASDPILPIPSELQVRVRNTSAIPLRAAYLHGPYTLYAACYPSNFDPNTKYTEQDTQGVPQFEPYLKAGGNWDATIKIPTHFANSQTGQIGPGHDASVTWTIEIVSQVVFSSSAVVHFELLVGRDAKSMEFFSSGGSSTASLGPPGKFHEFWSPTSRGEHVIATKGVFSQSITLRIDDTNSLWNSPSLPQSQPAQPVQPTNEVTDITTGLQQQELGPQSQPQPQIPTIKTPKKKIHLVVLTHGLHSNLGADMLYLKESIDAVVNKDTSEDSEQVIVRGFSGNAVHQPYFPLKNSKSNPLTRPFSARKEQAKPSSGPHSQPETRDGPEEEDHAYQITSISFIGHSLGGLIQTYAIAYIQKHSPEFFNRIQPVNFIALATPFLGLSNENPMYVRFALDLGLVGRTGQDLGLSWTAPKVRSGWGAIIGGRGDSAKDQAPSDPGAKPLLRILPCGPAHEVLHKFHHRTVYSNVVNDGIVPLRTSCLLFLDWRGLDRVEKARRGNGIVGTMAEWGWAELTGANSKSSKTARSGDIPESSGGEGASAPTLQGQEAVGAESENSSPNPEQFLVQQRPSHQNSAMELTGHKENSVSENSGPNSGPLSSFLSLFRPKETKPEVKHSTPSGKHAKIYKRSQTLANLDTHESPAPVRGNSIYEEEEGVYTPPKTTFFESAGDLLMPPLPPSEFIFDPAARSRTIFHDRIYHPDDIPPPMPEKRRTVAFGSMPNKNSKTVPPGQQSSSSGQPQTGESGLKVEEKIARAYHRDLSWRKVLVRLEPDAHNNIIVRRMFTNAYGWPVVKHLVDTHFGPSSIAEDDTFNRDSDRAKSPNVGPTSSGDEVEGQCEDSRHNEYNEHSKATPVHSAAGNGPEGSGPGSGPAEPSPDNESQKTVSTHGRTHSHYTDVSRQDSARWTDRQVDEDDEYESGLDEEDDAGYRWSPALRGT